MKPPEIAAPSPRPKSALNRLFRSASLTVLVLVFLLGTLWAAAALYFDIRVTWLRTPLVLAYVTALLAVWLFTKRRWLAAGLTISGFALVLAWWFALQPSNDREWQPDLAVLAYADLEGNEVTVHNIRNCDYRTETDFDVRHYDKTFALDRLRTADLYMV